MSILGIDYGANNIKFVLVGDTGAIKRRGTIKRLRTQRLVEVLCDALTPNVWKEIQTVEYVSVANSTTLLYPTHRHGIEVLVAELYETFPRSVVFLLTATFNLLPIACWDQVPIQQLIGTNFVGSAYYGSKLIQNGVVIDVGTSSTDVIGVVNGKPVLLAAEADFFNRLASGELWMAGGLYAPCEYVTPVIKWAGRREPIVPGVLKMFHVLYQLQLIDNEIMERELGYHLQPFVPAESLARAVLRGTDFVSETQCTEISEYVLHAFRRRVTRMVSHVVHELAITSPQYVALGFAGHIMTTDLPNPVIDLPIARSESLSACGAAQMAIDHRNQFLLSQ